MGTAHALVSAAIPGVSAARSTDGRLAVVYVPASGTEPSELTLNLHGLAPDLTAQWFNPARDAALQPEGAIATNRDGQKVRSPGDNGAGSGDWVLVLRASR